MNDLITIGMFDKETTRLLKCMEDMDPNTTEYKVMLKTVKAFEDMKVKEVKIQNEALKADMEERIRQAELEIKQAEHATNERRLQDELELRQLQADASARYNDDDIRMREQEIMARRRMDNIKLCVEIAGILLPLIFCWVWMCRGLAFEQTGVFVSNTFKGLSSKFFKMI